MNSIEYRQDKNILISTFSTPYDPMNDTMSSIQEITKRLNETDKDLHYVADMRALNISFADLVSGLAQAFSNPDSVFANPRLKTYTVGSNTLIRMGSQAVAEQSQYGKIPIKLFSSVEEALQAIDNQ